MQSPTVPAGTPQEQAVAPAGRESIPQAAPQVDTLTREAAIAASPRVALDTPSLSGSINLIGARLDDLRLKNYHETVDDSSPTIVLLSPEQTGHDGYFAEFGYTGQDIGSLPGPTTRWQAEDGQTLTPGTPIRLTYTNERGIAFVREISVDPNAMFSIADSITNSGDAAVSVQPYGRVVRHSKPQVASAWVVFEGLIGYLGESGLNEVTYSKIEEEGRVSPPSTNSGWLGITDKYWAATLLPDPKATIQAKYSFETNGTQKTYQTDYLGDAVTVAPGATASSTSRLFAGAKEVAVVDGYEKQLGLNRFELLIDWGYFYFITKPMFWSIDWLYRHVGNFGIAILLITLTIKIIFLPLANKSYASMAKMKAVQPEMAAIRERYADDKMKQQQALMDLYKTEKINPLAGCLPIVIQVPVFFALYKVLFISIEMRHAPFYGWIHDLSAPDPTNLFNLFGLVPFDPTTLPMIGHFLHIGVWPMIMGFTMFFQMKLNPAPPDPTQKMIFDWMPLIFTFMLASFSAGLVIYWAWNNTLSVIQQYIIMRRNGVKVELLDNLRGTFSKGSKASAKN